MKTLETERLILRTWQTEDLDDFYEYAKNPNVGPWAGWEPHVNKEVTAGILEAFLKNDDCWALVDKPTGKVIGSLGLHPDRCRKNDRTRMIGYVLSEDYWGRGLMTEGVGRVLRYAFEELELSLIAIYHRPENLRSGSVIRKIGFTYEGTLRQGFTGFDGKIYDSICHSMTREEYRAMQG